MCILFYLFFLYASLMVYMSVLWQNLGLQVLAIPGCKRLCCGGGQEEYMSRFIKDGDKN